MGLVPEITKLLWCIELPRITALYNLAFLVIVTEAELTRQTVETCKKFEGNRKITSAGPFVSLSSVLIWIWVLSFQLWKYGTRCCFLNARHLVVLVFLDWNEKMVGVLHSYFQHFNHDGSFLQEKNSFGELHFSIFLQLNSGLEIRTAGLVP